VSSEGFYLVVGIVIGAVLGFAIGVAILGFVAKQKELLTPASVVFERDKRGYITAIHYIPAGAGVGQ
jgi:hypothetical protein